MEIQRTTQKQIETREKNHLIFVLRGIISTVKGKRQQLITHYKAPMSINTKDHINDLIANAYALIQSIKEDQRHGTAK